MHIFANPNYNFIKWRWHALALSLLVIVSGLVTIWMRGPQLGIDFTGGTAMVLEFAQSTGDGTVRNALAPITSEATVQQFGPAADRQIMVRLPAEKGAPASIAIEAEAERVEKALRAANIGEFKVISTDIVGPVIGSDLQLKGIMATVTALGGILLYIWFRFRLTFAIGAIVATFHDILVTLVFLHWFHYDLSLNVVAAILTITGYSVNDTIVVFDRVRENQRSMRRETLEQVVNTSVNQTLSRTIITAGATFLAVVALFLFGGEVLRGLAFTLLVGILTGTYSTVFIASAIAIILSRRATGVTGPAPAPLRRA